MRRALIGMVALALAGCSVGADIPVAQAGVKVVHADYNGGKCAAIRDKAAPEFQGSTSAETWKRVCDQFIAGLGKFISGNQVGWNDQYNNGDHIITLNFESTFEKGKATEQFLFRIAGGGAVLVGYHVNSPVFDVVPAIAPTPSPGATPPAAPKPK